MRRLVSLRAWRLVLWTRRQCLNCDSSDYWIPLILGLVRTRLQRSSGLVPGDFAEASVVEDAGCPDTVVAVGVWVVASCDFEEVVEDADGFLKLLRGVSGEDGVDGSCSCIRLHEH